MQKEKMLRELYRGKMAPAEKNIIPGSEFHKQQQKLVELEKEIEVMLRGQEKERFHVYLTVQKQFTIQHWGRTIYRWLPDGSKIHTRNI